MVTHKRKQPLFEVMSSLTGSPNTPLWVLPGWILGGALVNIVSEEYGWIGIGAFAVLYAFVYYCFRYHRSGRRLSVELVEKSPPRMRGLILPLSTLGAASQTDQNIKDELERICQSNDHRVSDEDQQYLEQSNLKPALAALEYHYSVTPEANGERHNSLQEVWLITTEEKNPDGEVVGSSQGVGKLLERWFFTRHPEARERVVFHHDAYQEISLRVRSRDYSRLWEVVDAIYRKAPYKPEQIIAEISPGTKVMSIAVALACLPPGRTLEYMVTTGSYRTGERKPEGAMRPMLIDIDPFLQDEAS